jgi:galactokinase
MPKGVAVVIINSNFKRTLVGSEYNTRREQCETGARFFQQPALRDVTSRVQRRRPRAGSGGRQTRSPCADGKCPYRGSRRALEKGDLKRMGELMAESHASMRDDLKSPSRRSTPWWRSSKPPSAIKAACA